MVVILFFEFLYDVCQKYIVRNSKSNDKKRKLQCTVTEGTTLLHSAYGYSTDPKSTLLNLTEFPSTYTVHTINIMP